jgi:hypothetical protein
VAAYLELAPSAEPIDPIDVAALSSGFMTYPPDVHPRYTALRDAIAAAPTTIVLMPALELEACVAETVRRQARRSAGRMSAERAEAKIRERFARYLVLPGPKVATARPPGEVAVAIAALIQGQSVRVGGVRSISELLNGGASTPQDSPLCAGGAGSCARGRGGESCRHPRAAMRARRLA